MKNIIAIVLALVMSISSFGILSCSALSLELEVAIREEYNRLLGQKSDGAFYWRLIVCLQRLGLPKIYYLRSPYCKNGYHRIVINYTDSEGNEYVVDRDFTDEFFESYAIPYEYYMDYYE